MRSDCLYALHRKPRVYAVPLLSAEFCQGTRNRRTARSDAGSQRLIRAIHEHGSLASVDEEIPRPVDEAPILSFRRTNPSEAPSFRAPAALAPASFGRRTPRRSP